MRSLDKLIKIGRLILLYESLIAGFIFIAIAIAALVFPAMAHNAFKFESISEIVRLLSPVLPAGNFTLPVAVASILLGIFNLSVAWVAVYAKIERRGRE